MQSSTAVRTPCLFGRGHGISRRYAIARVSTGHLTQLMSGYWALPPMRALGQTTRAIRNIVGPNPNESWREKALRFPASVRKLGAPLERPDLEQPPTEDTQPEWQQRL